MKVEIPELVRPRHLLAAAATALLVAGCDAGGGVVPAGRYAYAAYHATPAGGDTIRLEGVLQIDAATADTVDGHWDVPQLHPELRLRVGDAGDVTLIAHPTYFGTLEHRFRRIGGGFACSGEYVWVVEGGEEESTPLSCSITQTAAAPAADTAADTAPAQPSSTDTAASPARDGA